MRTEVSIDIWDSEKNVQTDFRKILLTPTVCLQRSMRHLIKCPSQPLFIISNREYSAHMVELVQPSLILNVSSKSQDLLRSNLEEVTSQKITRRYWTSSGVTLMKTKRKMVSNITSSVTLKSKIILLYLDQITYLLSLRKIILL